MTVYNLFLEQVQKNTDSVAIEFGNKIITYAELLTEVNRISSYLKNNGIKKGDVVGISLHRSTEMIISLLGIIKIGAIYLPLDPAFPPSRLQYMLEDSNCPYLITENSVAQLFEYYSGRVLDVREYIKYDADYSEVKVDENSIAYILYTSGSTGNPKGVQIRNKSLVNFLLSMKESPGMTSKDSLLAVTTLSFDISGLEIYLPLISGAKLVLSSKKETIDGVLLLEKLKNVTVMQATPATWKLLLESGWNEKLKLKALCGGESLSRNLADRILERVDELWNMYGPTETTIWSSCYKVEKGNGIIHLGRPIANTQYYILDKNNHFCAPGVAGELLIGGEGLSIGYLNRDELTKEKFILNPFDKEKKTKVYKTGDLVRLNSNNQIEFLSRIDDQVKIRGYRIELGEIESTLRKNPFIKDVAVITKEFGQDDKRLVAFFVPDDNINSYKNISENDSIDWENNWEKLYSTAIKKNNTEENKNSEIGYLVIEQFKHDNKLREQYNEWINSTTERVISLNPKKVLEIGCGGGDIMKRIINKCKFYAATDISHTIIEHLKKDLDKLNIKNSSFELISQSADADLPFEKKSFDTIIINSVIQYFPNKNYLTKVLDKVLEYLDDSGCLFIGDVQSFSLLHNFNFYDQLRYVSSDTKVGEFNKLISNRIKHDPEFFVDPEFFSAYLNTKSDDYDLEIKLMRGSLENEPIIYNYDVYINKKRKVSDINSILNLEWDKKEHSLQTIKQILEDKKPTALFITNIPNKRICERFFKARFVENSKEENGVLKVLKSFRYIEQDVNPEDIWSLEDDSYKVDNLLPINGDQLHFDAIFVSKKISGNPIYPLRDSAKKTFNKKKYYNNPSLNFITDKFIIDLKDNLFSVLPDYMVPSMIIPFEELPLTANNKIDKKILINYDISEPSPAKDILLPETPTEIILYEIWKKLLGIKTLSIIDNFFELGGHSILAAQMFTEFEKETGKRIPLATLFSAQTIRQLAKIIDGNETEQRWSPLVEIKKGNQKTVPLFLIHGAEGNILLYRELAINLNHEQTVYGLQSRGLDGSDHIIDNIEEMAIDYIEAIKKAQSTGPYNIGGYCMGGTVAFEIAQQLRNNGDEVKNLFMLETYNVCFSENKVSTENSTADKIENIKFHFDNIKRLSGSDKVKFIRQKAEVLKRRTIAKINSLTDRIGINVKDNPGTSKKTFKVRDINEKAQAEYKPKGYNGKTILLKPIVSYSSEPDPNFGWDKLIKGEFKVYNLNLSPRGMLIEPFVKETAAIISKEMGDN
ncbi:MAG: amino acid adenylation domain-containing protein [Ignavibacteriota bacterium]